MHIVDQKSLDIHFQILIFRYFENLELTDRSYYSPVGIIEGSKFYSFLKVNLFFVQLAQF